MSKYLSVVTAMMVCMVAVAAQADQGISSGTLDSMGLSGLAVMSDSDAMSIRGMGYRGGSRSGYKHKKDNRPNAEADGKSWAEVELDGYKEEAEAGSRNSYEANGIYEASGDNFSEATMSKTESTTTVFSDGTTASVTKAYSIHVEAGGFSSAKAF
jgi:hypothetical protein